MNTNTQNRPFGPSAPSLVYSYRLPDLLEEVTKRTSYLGKMRNTEDGSHLLDRTSLTSGEGFMFDEFIQEAASETYEWVKAFGRNVTHAYHVESNPVTKVLYELAGVEATEDGKHIVINKPYSANDVAVEFIDSGTVDEEGYYLSDGTVDEEGYLVMNGAVDDEGYFVGGKILRATFKEIKLSYHNDSTIKLFVSVYGIINGEKELIGEQIIDKTVHSNSQDYLSSINIPHNDVVYDSYKVEVYLFEAKLTNKLIIRDDEFIEYVTFTDDGTNTQLYQAVEDCDSDNWFGSVEHMQLDPRDKVVFMLDLQCRFDYNMMNVVDRHIKEALVCFVIYRWLEYTLPNESQVWYDRFEDNAMKAKQGLDSETVIRQRRCNWF